MNRDYRSRPGDQPARTTGQATEPEKINDSPGEVLRFGTAKAVITPRAATAMYPPIDSHVKPIE